jgi:ATP-dependent RNA helicase RhlE
LRFEELALAEPLLRAVHAEGYTEATPIQQQAIPHVLAGSDLLGIAQTGTGKTAAFALPILQRLAPPARGARAIRVLVLAPTRELASQIAESFTSYGRHLSFTNLVVFGGVGVEPQKRALRQGADVLVATPGRLLDLMNQGLVDFRRLEVFVLDEADRMLDMGFVHDVRKVIAKLPAKRQTLLFSATMPETIVSLSRAILHDPVRVEVTPVATTAERIQQRVLLVEKADKKHLLELLLKKPQVTRAIVFTRTKHGANRVAEHLADVGIPSRAIHGNKSQGARETALNGFRDGSLRVLVATDIAARGIDVDGISHVINFDLPNVPEQYVHRIGRTARAGSSGMALSFCDLEERAFLRDIEKLIRQPIPVATEHPYRSPHPPHASAPPAPKGGGQPRPRRPAGRGGNGGGRGGSGGPPHRR